MLIRGAPRTDRITTKNLTGHRSRRPLRVLPGPGKTGAPAPRSRQEAIPGSTTVNGRGWPKTAGDGHTVDRVHIVDEPRERRTAGAFAKVERRCRGVGRKSGADDDITSSPHPQALSSYVSNGSSHTRTAADGCGRIVFSGQAPDRASSDDSYHHLLFVNTSAGNDRAGVDGMGGAWVCSVTSRTTSSRAHPRRPPAALILLRRCFSRAGGNRIPTDL